MRPLSDAPAAAHPPTAARLAQARRTAWALIAAGVTVPLLAIWLAASTAGRAADTGVGTVVPVAVLVGPVVLVAGVIAQRRWRRVHALLHHWPWVATTVEAAGLAGIRLPRVVLCTGDGRLLGLAREPRWRIAELRRPAGATLWSAGPPGDMRAGQHVAVAVPGPGTLLLARLPRDDRQRRRWRDAVG